MNAFHQFAELLSNRSSSKCINRPKKRARKKKLSHFPKLFSDTDLSFCDQILIEDSSEDEDTIIRNHSKKPRTTEAESPKNKSLLEVLSCDSDTFDDTVVFDAAKTKEHERLSDLIIDENSDCEKTTTPEQERPSALIDENSNIKFSQPFLCEDIHISSYESANTQENTLNILNHSIFQKMNETTKYTQKVDYKKNGLAAKLTELIRNKKERSQDLESYRTIKVIHSARLYSRLLIQFSFDDTQNTQDPEQNFLFLHESTTKFIKNGHQFQLFFENENLQVIKKGSWNIYVNISKIKAVSGN